MMHEQLQRNSFNILFQTLDKDSLLLSEKEKKKCTDLIRSLDSRWVNATCSGRSLTHYASRNGHDSLLNELFQQGADLNIVDENRWSPTHFAVEYSHIDVLRVLYKCGANLDIPDINGTRPYDITKEKSYYYYQEREIFCAYKLRRYFRILESLEIAKFLKLHHRDQTSFLNQIYFYGCYKDRCFEMLEHKIMEKIIANFREGLEKSIHKSASEQKKDLFQLVEGGVIGDVITQIKANPLLIFATKVGVKLTHFAAKNGHLKLLYMLAQYGVDLDETDENGRTPMHLAVQNSQDKVLYHLCKWGANRNKQDDDGNTPNNIACKEGFSSAKNILYCKKIRCIINQLRFYSIEDFCRQDPNSQLGILQHISRYGCIKNKSKYFTKEQQEMLEEKLKDFCNKAMEYVNNTLEIAPAFEFLKKENIEEFYKQINANPLLIFATLDGKTFTHIAVEKQLLGVLETLGSYGADFNKADSEFRTPMHIAKENVRIKVSKVVEQLEVKLGVSADELMIAVMPAAGSAGGEQAEQQTEYQLMLESFDENRIAVIKAVRAATGYDLKKAKDMVDGALKEIKEGVSKEDEDEITAVLVKYGADKNIISYQTPIKINDLRLFNHDLIDDLSLPSHDLLEACTDDESELEIFGFNVTAFLDEYEPPRKKIKKELNPPVS